MLIEFSYLFKKYNVHATGILHIGAHHGQEAEAYWNEGVRNIVFVEAHRPTYKVLCQNMLRFPGVIAVNACISDKDGEIVNFNLANNDGQSSSMLEFDTHSQEHPTVIFTDRTRLQTMTISTMFKDRKLNPSHYNFINLDIQGAELMALRGMDLSLVDYVYIEVNKKHLYKNCPLLPDIDAYLLSFGLHRVETKMTNHGWGDAFYVRKETNAMHVPKIFQPEHPIKYPKDNDIDFENWFRMNYQQKEGRIYLPIMWTAYYCKNKYGKDQSAINSLQAWLNRLDRSKKYFTIVQYDDGILNDLSGLDIKVFSMSGKGDYYLPLLCQDHEYSEKHERDIFCSFIGRNTHPIRSEILKIKRPHWFISPALLPLPGFCAILSRSIFTLCPRGYGPTSFRIKESIQYGSIPVYISDNFIEPYGIPFEKYGVLVKPEDIWNLPAILEQVDINERQLAIRDHQHLFTYEGALNFYDYHNAL